MKKLFFTLLILFATVSMWQAMAQTSPTFDNLPANIAQANDAGVCGAVVTWSAVTATDPDTNTSCTVSQTDATNLSSGSTFPIGTTTIEYTAVDNGTDPDTVDTFTVTVTDTENPVAVCQDITVELDTAGNYTMADNEIDNGSTDNCSGFTYTASKTDFDCRDLGNNTVTLTITDNSGNNTDTCTATVTVQDNIPPVAVCQDITVQLDANGNASITGAVFGSGSTDNCDDSISVLPNTFNCSNVGDNTVTLTITEDGGGGNTDTCTATVTVVDNVAPVAVGKNATLQLDGSGVATLEFADVEDGSSDNCPWSSYSLSQTAFDCASIALSPISVDYEVIDQAGNVSSAVSVDVIVQDTVLPVAVGKDVTLQLDGSGVATLEFADVEDGSSDNCSWDSYSLSQTFFGCTTLGSPISVNYKVIDPDSNQSPNFELFVTVEDNIAPTLNPTNFTADLNLDPNIDTVVNYTDISDPATDNCITINSEGIDHDNDPNTAPVASIQVDCDDALNSPLTVTIEATDPSGNLASTTVQLTVTDSTPPVMDPGEDINLTVDAGECTAIANYLYAGADANCFPVEVTQVSPSSPVSGDPFPVGTTTVTMRGTSASGVTTDVPFNVNVVDDEDPVAVCNDITVELGASGDVTITAADIDNGSSDNCGIDTLTLNREILDCADIGTINITLTVTDIYGNDDTCVADVTVVDNEDPVAVCQNITVQLDAEGNATITAADIDNGSSDNCDYTTLTLDNYDFTCDNVGANNPVTLTITDDSGNGNSSMCSATVTVEDNIAPVADCMDITVQLDAEGNASIVPSDVDGGGGTDNCGVVNLQSVVPNNFACADVGENVVVLTVNDGNGNIGTCEANVVVQDNVDPVAVCQDITVELDAAGNYTMADNEIDGGSTDNCTAITFSASQTGFACAVGPNTVTLTITDDSGNTNTCDAIVTVEDNIAPVAVCSPYTLVLDANGGGSIVPGDVNGGSYDPCGIASMSIDVEDFTCADIGDNDVTLTVTDVNGNTSTCTTTVTVEDNTAPTAVCQDITVQLDASGNATITGADVDGGSDDVCGIDTLSVSPSSFDCSNVGDNTVTLTVTDVNGNFSTCSTATVTIEDNEFPMVYPKPSFYIALDPISGYEIINYNDLTTALATDNCGIAAEGIGATYDASMPVDCASALASPLTVTLYALDNNGNISSTDITVTVEDTSIPVFNPVQDIVEPNFLGVCGAIVYYNFSSADANCLPVEVTQLSPLSPVSGDVFPVGTTTVTMLATSTSGATNTVTFDITIEDVELPIAVGKDVTLQLDVFGMATLEFTDVEDGSSDNCSWVSNSLSQTAFDCASVGLSPISVDYTVIDQADNVSLPVSVNVTVEDNIAPVAVCKDITVQLNASGDATITVADIDNGSTDNCGVVTYTAAQANFGCADVDSPVTVALTVMDAAGNSDTCNANVTVEDNIAPVADCMDITVQLDAAGNASIVPSDVDGGGGTDNCGVVNLQSVVPSDFACANVGENVVVLTVNDGNGNIGVCDANVTVEDNVAPVLDPVADNTFNAMLNIATGMYDVTYADVTNAPATDACGFGTEGILDGPAGTIVPFVTVICTDALTETVYIGATDVYGNYSEAAVVINIVDPTPPIWGLVPDILEPIDAGTCGGVVNYNIAAADANCGPVDVVQIDPVSPVSGDVFPIGVTTVTMEATNIAGVTSQEVFTVTVFDNVAPVAVCSDVTVVLDAEGNASITAADVGSGSSDNCLPITMSIDLIDFGCGDVGNHTVTLTVTEVLPGPGVPLFDTCTATVTVQDNEFPVIYPESSFYIALDLNNGDGIINYNDLTTALATDNCGIAAEGIGATYDASMPVDCASALASPLTVTLYALDNSGNISSTDITVTVEDTSIPVFNPVADIVEPNDPGVCGAIVNYTISSADANCAPVVETQLSPLSPVSGDVFPIGTTHIIMLGTSSSGATNTVEFDVTVLDVEDPVAVCNNITVQLDANGDASVTGASVDGGSFDNCDYTLSVLPSSFGCSNVGDNTVTLTITDDSGNTDTCTATVTVEDNIAPTAICATSTGDSVVTNSVSDSPGIVIDGSDPNPFSTSITVPDDFEITDLDVNLDIEHDYTGDLEITLESPAGTQVLIFSGADGCSGNDLMTRLDDESVNPLNCQTSDAFPEADYIPSNPLDAFDGESTLGDWTLTVEDTYASLDDGILNSWGVTYSSISAGAGFALDASGNVSITPGDIDNGSWDACGIASMSVSPDTFDCSNVGVNTVTLTVTDINGNSSTCTTDIIIVDNIAPAAVCQNITVQLDANGDVSITGADVDGGSDDVCGIDTLSVSPSSFDCSNAGDNTVTLTVTDVNGNSSICTATVTVEDNVAPTAICATGDSVVTNSVSDSPGIVIDGSDPNPFSTSITVPDDFEITDLDVNLDIEHTYTWDLEITLESPAGTQVLIFSGIADGCSGNDLMTRLDDESANPLDCQTPDAFPEADYIPSNPLDAFDGESTLGDWTLTVEDRYASLDDGILNSWGVTYSHISVGSGNTDVILDVNGNASITVGDIDNGSWDTCGIASMSIDVTDFTCADIGDNDVTLTVTDVNGNTSTCVTIVNVIDDIPPLIACPADVFDDSDPGVCGAEVVFADASAIDVCGIASIVQTFGLPSGSVFPIGVSRVEFTATDNGGNETTCEFFITIVDDEAPVAVCQDFTVELDASGNASITAADLDAGSTDNCPIDFMTLSQSDFDCSDVGDVEVTLTVFDEIGNSSACTATITVIDDIAPEIVCEGQPYATTVLEEFEGSSVPAGWSTQIIGGTWDWTFGSGVMPGASNPNFPTNAAIFSDAAAGFGDGNNVASLFSPVYDLSESTSAEISFDYSLGDFAGDGLLRVEVYDGADWQEVFLADGSDIPPTNSGVLDMMAFANADFQVRFTYDDEDSGWNWGAGVDNFTLTASNPVTPLVVVLDENGMAQINTADLLISVDEACNYIVTGPVGTETGTVSDSPGIVINAGNSSFSTSITVPDDFEITDLDVNLDISHTWVGDLIVTLTSPEGTEVTLIDQMGAPVTFYGCSGNDLDITLDDDADSAIEDECNVGVVPTAEGSFIPNEALSAFNGESTMGDWTLTVEDTFASFDHGILNSWGLTYTYDSETINLDCSNLGSNVFDITVTDSSGNQAICQATVVVVDETDPIITCVASQTPTETGSASDTPNLAIPDNSSTGVSTTLSVTEEVDITDLNVDVAIQHTWVGDLIVTLTSPEGTEVTLIDRMGAPPGTVGCSGNDLDVTLDDAADSAIENECNFGVVPTAEGSFTPNEALSAFNGESTMGDWTLFVSDNAGFDLGTLMEWGITYTYDGVPTENYQIFLNEEGWVLVDPFDLIADTNEACGIDVAAADRVYFTCEDVGAGPIFVTVFVSDFSGNLASCVAVVEVFDAIAPVLVCPEDQTQNPEEGNLLYVLPDYIATGEATAVDNCTNPSATTQDPAPGTLLPPDDDSTYTVTFTATDDSGNSSECSFELKVEILLAIGDFNIGSVIMYPNPASDFVMLSNPQSLNLDKAAIYDLTGRLVQNVDLTDMGTEISIDVSHLASATYMVLIQGENGQVTKQLIKD